MIVRRGSKPTDLLERTGEGGGVLGGEEAVDRISPPSPSLSTAESSMKMFFFLGAESDTRSELEKEKRKENKNKNSLVSE